MFIYKATNKINGKVYIGKTVRPVDVRWAQHLSFARMKGGCPYLGAAIRKYGALAFQVEQLAQAGNEEELENLEREFIQKFKSHNRETGYNLTLGGEGLSGHSHSSETKAKIAAGRQGENHPMYGRHHSDEAKLKIAQHSKGSSNPFFGKTHTEESRKNMGTRGSDHPNFGKPLPQATRKKIQDANSKTFVFMSPSKEVVAVKNLKAFCRDHFLSAPHMNSVYHGKRSHHKGWTRCWI